MSLFINKQNTKNKIYGIKIHKGKIIIIGGGFGGCHAAKILAKEGYEITLFDKRNHHVFQPLL